MEKIEPMGGQSLTDTPEAALTSPRADPMAALLALGKSLPGDWGRWPVERCFQYLRFRVGLTQRELSEKSGVAQCVISRLESGGAARMDTWSRLFAAMGLRLAILPVSEEPVEALERRAQEGRMQEPSPRRRPRWRRTGAPLKSLGPRGSEAGG